MIHSGNSCRSVALISTQANRIGKEIVKPKARIPFVKLNTIVCTHCNPPHHSVAIFRVILKSPSEANASLCSHQERRKTR
jgi:hypothetical protein